MTWTASDWWVVATAAFCGIACGVPGVFLLLRRLSMLGDAISHAILPGIAAAFILTGTRDVAAMLAGATIVGLLTASASAGLARLGRVPEDAAMGVVFTSLFALGVLLITIYARDVDLDPSCVLYGFIDTVALDSVPVAGMNVPRAAIILGVAMVVTLVLVALFLKELTIAAFDPYLASTMGLRAAWINYGLIGLVSGVTVVSFEAVGSILVVAMLVIPGATALLLTDRLPRLLILAAVVAVLGAVGGYALAVHFNSSVAGMMSAALGVQFLVAVLFSPKQGVVARRWRLLSLSLRIRREDLLGSLYRARESGVLAAAPPPGVRGRLALLALSRRGLVSRTPAGLALTDRGVRAGERIIRSHRLWETYLNERLGLPPDHVHDPSERMEHFLSDDLVRDVRAQVRGDTDPQGKGIPR
jgi:manganese/zinc/iron transport system permease protein